MEIWKRRNDRIILLTKNPTLFVSKSETWLVRYISWHVVQYLENVDHSVELYPLV